MITPKDIFKDTQHLDAGIWNKVNRNLLAKSIAELMREDVIKPVIVSQQKKGHTLFRLETDNENIYYRECLGLFRLTWLLLIESWLFGVCK